MVQIVKYRERYGIDGEGDYSLNCYLNVTPDVWYIGYDGTNYIQKGSNTLHLTDLDLNNYYHSLYYNLYNYGNYDITSKSITFPQYFDPDKIWITYNNKGEAPYYKLIENVGLNQSFNLSKSDFKIMKPINITLPQNTSSSVYSVRG